MPSSLNFSIVVLSYQLLKFLRGQIKPQDNKRGEIDALDRTSQLPVHLLHHILSFLPMKDAFRTTILSKSWKNACATLPTLKFHHAFFHGMEIWKADGGKTCRRKREKLMNFIEQTLQRRCSQGINISKLALDIPYAVGCSSEGSILVDRWIGYSVKSNIKHLTLRVFNTVAWYSLPPTLFSLNSLTMLELSGCKMELPLDRNINLPLKKLRLTLCHLDYECFQNLIHSCPDLEDLKIVLCQGLKRMMIPHLLKLKNFLLNEIESIEIEAPMNLEEFFYFGNYIPCPINVWACQNLRTLSLYNMTITDNWFHCLLSKLPLLSRLSLSGCNRLEKLKISGHSLTRLYILCLENLAHVIIHTPNLLEFGYHGDIISFSFNAPRLLKVRFHLETKVVDDSWHFRKVEFLAKFSHCKTANFWSRSNSYMDVLIPKVLRESLVPPLYNVKHFSLYIHNGFESLVPNAAVDLVDGLLWICPHLETLTIQFSHIKKSIKFSYEEVMDNEGNLCPCCKSLPIGCWQHCLKKVMVENTLWTSKSEIKHFNGFEDDTNLKKFFLENAKILERVDDFTDCKLKNRSWWATLRASPMALVKRGSSTSLTGRGRIPSPAALMHPLQYSVNGKEGEKLGK